MSNKKQSINYILNTANCNTLNTSKGKIHVFTQGNLCKALLKQDLRNYKQKRGMSLSKSNQSMYLKIIAFFMYT